MGEAAVKSEEGMAFESYQQLTSIAGMACELLDRHGEYDLQKKCPVTADPAFFARELALIQLELGRVLLAAESEGWMPEGALEGMGSGNYKTIYENKIQFTVEDRVAGALLRLLAFCGKYGIDIGRVMSARLRHDYNETF